MRQVVTIPLAQSHIASVFKKRFQRWRFDVAVAEHHVGFALMPGRTSFGAPQVSLRIISPPQSKNTVLNKAITPLESVTNRHHYTWGGNFRFRYGRRKGCLVHSVTSQTKYVRIVYRTQPVSVIAILCIDRAGWIIGRSLRSRAIPHAFRLYPTFARKMGGHFIFQHGVPRSEMTGVFTLPVTTV